MTMGSCADRSQTPALAVVAQGLRPLNLLFARQYFHKFRRTLMTTVANWAITNLRRW